MRTSSRYRRKRESFFVYRSWIPASAVSRQRTSNEQRATLRTMPDFWQSCGYNLLRKGADGRLVVTDDYLRFYYRRPELAPVAESCPAERALHASLIAQPRRAVPEPEIAAVADADARE